VAWMRCVSESLQLPSASMQLRGRDNPHPLDQSPLLPLDPHIRPKSDLLLSLLRPSLSRGTGTSLLLWPRKPCGTLSPSKPACDSADSPRPVLTATLSSLFLSLTPCMGRERSSGCCVILRSRFIGATHNFVPPSVLCRTTAPTNVIYIS
jgi:hypothetical protein